jgi:hypothetical protein
MPMHIPKPKVLLEHTNLHYTNFAEAQELMFTIENKASLAKSALRTAIRSKKK